jgi:hypothetical protein
MPIVPNFKITQTLGVPDSINFEDISTGTDNLVTARKIYITTASGSFLVEQGTITNYELWALVDATKTLKVLGKDYALRIKIDLVDVAGAILYSKDYTLLFTFFNEEFDLQLGQAIAGNPMLISDNNYLLNKVKFINFIDSAKNAMLYLNEINTAQLLIDEATKMRKLSIYLFNINA